MRGCVCEPVHRIIVRYSPFHLARILREAFHCGRWSYGIFGSGGVWGLVYGAGGEIVAQVLQCRADGSEVDLALLLFDALLGDFFHFELECPVVGHFVDLQGVLGAVGHACQAADTLSRDLSPLRYSRMPGDCRASLAISTTMMGRRRSGLTSDRTAKSREEGRRQFASFDPAFLSSMRLLTRSLALSMMERYFGSWNPSLINVLFRGMPSRSQPFAS